MAEYGYWHDANFRRKMRDALKEGRLVAGASDTVIGLLAPASIAGKQALDTIKQRSEKPYIVLVSSVDQAAKFSDVLSDSLLHTILEKHWPGPLTIVVAAKSFVPKFLTSQDNTIALRMPKHVGLQLLLAEYGAPLFSTSANRAGELIPDRVGDIDPAIADGVAYVVDDESHSESQPSTIVTYIDGQLDVVRQGAVTVDI